MYKFFFQISIHTISQYNVHTSISKIHINYTYSIYYKYNLPLTPRSITCYIHPIHLISNIWKDPNTNRVLHANIVNNCTIIIRSLPYQACIKHWFIYTISNDYRHTWYFEFGQVWGRGWGKLVNSSIHGNRSPHITDSINQLHTKQRPLQVCL